MTAGCTDALRERFAPAGRVRLHVLLAAIALVSIAACSKEQPLSAEDKAIFLRAGDLERFGFRYENVEAHETFTKLKNFDGTHEVTYQFETPGSESENPLFMFITVSVERRASDALISQKAGKLGLSIGFSAEGAEEREVPATLPYGDEARLALLVKNGNPIGNTFSMRDGAKTYLMVVSGLYFSDPELFKEVMGPKLERFASYEP